MESVRWQKSTNSSQAIKGSSLISSGAANYISQSIICGTRSQYTILDHTFTPVPHSKVSVDFPVSQFDPVIASLVFFCCCCLFWVGFLLLCCFVGVLFSWVFFGGGRRGSLLLLFALFLFNNSYGFQLCNSGPVITQ